MGPSVRSDRTAAGVGRRWPPLSQVAEELPHELSLSPVSRQQRVSRSFGETRRRQTEGSPGPLSSAPLAWLVRASSVLGARGLEPGQED